MKMTKRQEKLLQLIISEYVETARPVGSEYLAKKSGLKVSPATIRNEMVYLTLQGYLVQPHTSAGRIVTGKGFRYCIENLLVKRNLSGLEKRVLGKIKQSQVKPEILTRQIAKQIAALASGLMFLAFDDNDFYYTGLAYLFNQPEFSQPGTIYSISQVVDHLDRVMVDIFELIGDETEILIGEKNPFSEFCGSVITRCQLPERSNYSLIGLLGPVRMDYNRNLALINYARDLIGQ